MKFLETVVLCFSSKGNMVGSGRRNSSKINQKDDFSLTDLPTGHPKITREALESVAHFAFIVLRGLVEVGGQMSCTLPPTYSDGEEGKFDNLFTLLALLVVVIQCVIYKNIYPFRVYS